MKHDPIIRPQNLLPQILQGERLLEYYSEGAGPNRNLWSYLILVETDRGRSSGGAGAVVDQRWGLKQTLSFSKAELEALKLQLESFVLPVAPSGGVTLDGENGCLRIYGCGGCMDLNWTGNEPEAWAPVFAWICSVWKMILDKSFDDAFNEPLREGDVATQPATPAGLLLPKP